MSGRPGETGGRGQRCRGIEVTAESQGPRVRPHAGTEKSRQEGNTVGGKLCSGGSGQAVEGGGASAYAGAFSRVPFQGRP